jgi:5-amino-6-(5-phosphoribosylamino)uracil reductase
MADLTFNQLLPEPGAVYADELIAGADFGSLAGPERPHTLVNFVATADGSVTFEGRSGAIGDEGDRTMFHTLREHVDAVLAGTGTLRTERYGRILGRSERRERRAAAGLTPEPLACVITRSGELPLDIPLFAEPEARIVVFSPTRLALPDLAASVHLEVFDGSTERPLATVMRRLREHYEVRSLLCEGGPSLFASLLHDELVDEFFLTIAPKLAGGSAGPTVATGEPLPDLARLEVCWLLERQGSLFVRYRRA